MFDVLKWRLFGNPSTSRSTKFAANRHVWRQIALGVLATAFVNAASAQSLSYRGIEELDRVVAVVDEDVIVMSELVALKDTVRAEIGRSGSRLPPGPVLERQVLDRLILERLQLQVAERIGVRVRDEELNRAVADIAKRNNLSLSEFREILERDGVPFGIFRERIRKEMIIARVRQREVRNRIRVREQEIDDVLRAQDAQGGQVSEYRLGHILVAVPSDADQSVVDEKKAFALELIQSLNAGDDFAETARANSDGGQAANGGDLGWREPKKLPSIFATVVPTMEKGEIRGPIKSDSGFHIVKVTDIKGGQKLFISQTHPRHILVQTNELTSDREAQLRLEQLRERIIQGDEFGPLARAHSDDRGSAVQDGDLGWVAPGDLVPEFERAMDALAPGDISPPFKTSFGWHIVQVLERRDHDNTAEVRRAEARKAIRERRIRDELDAWLAQLKDEAFIEYRLDE